MKCGLGSVKWEGKRRQETAFDSILKRHALQNNIITDQFILFDVKYVLSCSISHIGRRLGQTSMPKSRKADSLSNREISIGPASKLYKSITILNNQILFRIASITITSILSPPAACHLFYVLSRY